VTRRNKPETIDEYIDAAAPGVRPILRRIRRTIRGAAPDARETINYGIPAFTENGTLVYFAAFKGHIGFYPPVRGDTRLEKALARYAGEKGNLRFPLDAPIPYALIERIVRLRVWQDRAGAASRARPKARPRSSR
jgi:uncharacterized protein YdhG (YjbR/CyaY superfamily)